MNIDKKALLKEVAEILQGELVAIVEEDGEGLSVRFAGGQSFMFTVLER